MRLAQQVGGKNILLLDCTQYAIGIKKGQADMKSSGIGGQAVIEGIMMRNKNIYAVGVRKSDHEIVVEKGEYTGVIKNDSIKKLPIVRGVVSFIDSLVLGMKTLNLSASFYEEDETAQPTKADKFLNKLFKGKAEDVIMGATMVISVLMAIGIFMVLPYLISNVLKPYITSDAVLAVIEGCIRIGLFIGYVLLITLMKDIQRTFRYHGAEHKCINCIETGKILNVENVRQSSKQHKRCGTSFLLIVMVVSIIFFIFIPQTSPILRIAIRLLLLPVVAGVSYEFIRLAGNSDSFIANLLSAPGMLLQKLTTKEPDDSMIEVAIKAVEAVFDWKEYQVEQGFLTQEEADHLKLSEGIEFL